MSELSDYISSEFAKYIRVDANGKTYILTNGAIEYFEIVNGASFLQDLLRPTSELFQFLIHPEQNHSRDEIPFWVDAEIPDTAIADIGWFLMMQGNQKARILCKGFNRYSVRSIFHHAVGWKPSVELSLDAAAHLLNNLLPYAKKQDSPYDEAFVEAFEALYCFDFGRGNTRYLIGRWVWNYFDGNGEFVRSLRERNPMRDEHNRQHCHYYFLTPELRVWLDKHVRNLTRLMNKASRKPGTREEKMKKFREYMKEVPYIIDELTELLKQQRNSLAQGKTHLLSPA